MKNYIGSILVMTTMMAYCFASPNCTQPLEIRHHNKILLHKLYCNQVVNNADLQMEPEVYYDAHLSHHFNYTLFLLENNNNTGSYKIHWILTDIIPENKSLTANKKVVEGYRPPMNNVTTSYTMLLYKHRNSLHLKSPSLTEMDNFIPSSWAVPIQNITLENNATFQVIGKNTSHPHSSGAFYPHTSTQTPTLQTHPTAVPTFQPPKTTIQPTVTNVVTEKMPGYNFYNSTNNSSTNHKSPSHHHKSGASNNICSFTFMFIPLISVLTNVI